MHTRTPSLTLARAFTLVAITAGMAAAALAQQANTGTGSSSGVTNMSAPTSVAPVSVTPAPTSTPVSTAAVQAAVTQSQTPSNTSLNPPATNRVGDATNYLFALQAGGQHASRNAYPVTSDVAQRTYTRYLESFTHKIPETSDSQVGSSSGGRR